MAYSLPPRPESGSYRMPHFELPSISRQLSLSPPPTPDMPPTYPASRTESSAGALGRPTKRVRLDTLSRQLPPPTIYFTEPQYGGLDGNPKANTNQQLPPILHILADVLSLSSQHHGPQTPGYPAGGLPTPSLSPTTPFHCFRFPGPDAFALITPPQSRQPSIVDLRLPGPHDVPCHPSRPSHASIWPAHRQVSPERSARGQKRKRQGSEERDCQTHRDITPPLTDEPDSDASHNAVVKSTKSKACKTIQVRSKEQGKRNNKEYEFVENLFIIYHIVDRGLHWKEVEVLFSKRFPDRTRGGVQCQYYRLNERIPKLDSEGLLDFGPFTKEELEDKEVVSQRPYPLESGVRYRIHHVKCREGMEVRLAERYPEEVVYGGHDWILPEHRDNQHTKLDADKRARQREEYLRSRCRGPPPILSKL
ncbi:hypothetical protein QBC34DRAFT_13656 [Podospora aff. communis PSN243]|uniref:Myb-like domain-containing protein n=1 Tax=Podospora aff. communis PSN243 TaxID=3040156 RepID=A0AAV9H738_9PEZI|nr:hypothetical protein QBC34DRAFT_13656 [Podospora aff. communis PSN243]